VNRLSSFHPGLRRKLESLPAKKKNAKTGIFVQDGFRGDDQRFRPTRFMQTDGKIHDITGVILAGGRSSRMGRDKATLKVMGVSLFERILQVMRGLFST